MDWAELVKCFRQYAIPIVENEDEEDEASKDGGKLEAEADLEESLELERSGAQRPEMRAHNSSCHNGTR